MNETAALKAVPLEGILSAFGALGLNNEADATGYRPLRRVSDMLGQEEDVAFANNDVVELTIIEYLQNHIPFKLVEELFYRVVMKVSTLIWTADNESHHVSVLPDLLVSDRRLQQVAIFIDPGLKVECRQLRHLRLVLSKITGQDIITDSDEIRSNKVIARENRGPTINGTGKLQSFPVEYTDCRKSRSTVSHRPAKSVTSL
jgi:hypothetical protein